jgi:hypothetical protein
MGLNSSRDYQREKRCKLVARAVLDDGLGSEMIRRPA